MAVNPDHLVTAEELFQYPDHDRLELVAGNLRLSEPPGGAHGQIAMRLGAKERTVVIHRADRSTTRLATSDWLDGEDVIPGFRRSVADLLPGPR